MGRATRPRAQKCWTGDPRYCDILENFSSIVNIREGKEVPGNRGYKYFGAARDLPGVREMFESDAPKEARIQIDS